MTDRLILSACLGLCLSGCVGNMNPTGGNSTRNDPYYKTREAGVVKKIWSLQALYWSMKPGF